MNKGFEFAFKGAMNAYGILAHKAVFWLGHVTGTGGDSVPHYWPNDCETCKEISKFVSDWSPERQLTPRALDGATCPKCHSNNAFNAVICVDCGWHTPPRQ